MIVNLVIRIFIFYMAYWTGRFPFICQNRLMIMPVLLAFNILWKQYVPFVSGGMLLFLANSIHVATAGMMFSLFDRNVFRVNKVLKPFIVLWTYLTIASLLGEKPVETMIYYADVALEWILPLAAYGYWLVYTPGAWQRTLLCLVPPLVLIEIKYLRVSNMTMAESYNMVDRAGIDSEMLGDERSLNVNSIALIMSSLIPWCVFAVVVKMKSYWGWILKGSAVVALVGLTAVLVRSGSRGGILVFLPLAYLVFHIKGKSSWIYKATIFVVLLCAVGYGMFKTSGFSSLADMRVFNFDNTYQDVSSGRFAFYEMILDRMHPTAFNTIFGGGGFYDHYFTRVPMIGNGHSSWVQLYALGGVFGAVLFSVFIIAYLRVGFRLGFRGQLAMVMLGVWILTGLGESVNLNQGGMGAKALMGIGMGLLCRGKTVLDDELVNGYDKRKWRMRA